MHTDMTGIILSGGKSLRMGRNKSLLKIGDSTAIERIVALMRDLFPRLILSTNSPAEYEFLGLRMVEDTHLKAGPIAGIHAGLTASTTDKNFVISCDMQLMNRDTIDFLASYRTEKRITIAKADGYYQQLAGVYHKDAIPVIDALLADNDVKESRAGDQKKRGCKVLELVRQMDAKVLDAESEIPNYRAGTFYNMNKPHEYEEILNILASGTE